MFFSLILCFSCVVLLSVCFVIPSMFFSLILCFSCVVLVVFLTHKLRLHSRTFSSSTIKTLLRYCFPRILCLISFYQNRRRLLSWYTDLLSESPTQTIVVHRLGAPRTIVTANPDNVEYILKTNFANFPKGKPFTEILGDFLGVGIFNVDGEKWITQRKLASHEFSTRSLREFLVEVLEDQVENRLIPILEESVENGGTLDMQELLRRFGFDVICRVSLGMDPDCMDLSEPPPLLASAFDAASAFSAMRAAEPIAGIWKLKRAMNVGKEKELKEAVATVRGSVEEMIRVKKEKIRNLKIDGGDLLSRFLESGLDDETVRDMVVSFLMAGRDTTSAALTWLFWLLTEHREIEKQALAEVLATIGGGGNPGFDDLKKMNFVKACLCESMRLYPPVVWDSKHAENDDVLADGTPVGKGDRVTYFQYGMGRMEKLWGDNRLEFVPNRWLDDESGTVKPVSPFKFPVFQAGPRICLGKEMAFVQMKYVLAAVLRRFELVPVRAKMPIFVPMLTAYMAGGFNVKVLRRVQQ